METHQHGIHPQLSHPFALLWLQTVGPTIRHVIRRTVIRTISATVAGRNIRRLSQRPDHVRAVTTAMPASFSDFICAGETMEQSGDGG